jgi:hypothetical protein
MGLPSRDWSRLLDIFLVMMAVTVGDDMYGAGGRVFKRHGGKGEKILVGGLGYSSHPKQSDSAEN